MKHVMHVSYIFFFAICADNLVPGVWGCPFCIAGECKCLTAPQQPFDSSPTVGLSNIHGGGECNSLTAPPQPFDSPTTVGMSFLHVGGECNDCHTIAIQKPHHFPLLFNSPTLVGLLNQHGGDVQSLWWGCPTVAFTTSFVLFLTEI